MNMMTADISPRTNVIRERMKSIESAAAAAGNQDSRSSSLTHTHTHKNEILPTD